jgi:hypothetical protein
MLETILSALGILETIVRSEHSGNYMSALGMLETMLSALGMLETILSILGILETILSILGIQ